MADMHRTSPVSSNGAENWEVPGRALMWHGYTDGFPEQKVT